MTTFLLVLLVWFVLTWLLMQAAKNLWVFQFAYCLLVFIAAMKIVESFK